MTRTLIGIDIGTQGTKGVLFTASGKRLAAAFEPSRLHRPDAVTVQEDPERQVASVCRVIQACVRQARVGTGSVAAVAMAGQMAGLIGVGRNGRNVTPYDSWLDVRCTPYIERMTRKAGGAVLARTGCPPSFNHGPKILWWKHERPRVYRSVRGFVQPAGYAAMRLCGLDGSGAFLDKTYLHFSGFADNRRGLWDSSLCGLLGVDSAKLPRIVDSTDVVGELCPSMAKRCGLRTGVPIVAGCGDTAASFLSCGATREGVCVDVAGTASVFAATTSAFRADSVHQMVGCGQSAVPGLWHPYAYINGGGLNLEWFRQQIAPAPGDRESAIRLELLDRLAERLTIDDDSPMFVPHLSGRVCPSQPQMRGAWLNLARQHTLAHLYLAMLEGVALEYGVYVGVVRKLYPGLRLRELRVTGGGERSGLWNRIKSETLDIPIARIRRSEGAPAGAAIIAGVGAGLFKDVRQMADRWIGCEKPVRPERPAVAQRRGRIAAYEAILEHLAAFSHDMNRRHS